MSLSLPMYCSGLAYQIRYAWRAFCSVPSVFTRKFILLPKAGCRAKEETVMPRSPRRSINGPGQSLSIKKVAALVFLLFHESDEFHFFYGIYPTVSFYIVVVV